MCKILSNLERLSNTKIDEITYSDVNDVIHDKKTFKECQDSLNESIYLLQNMCSFLQDMHREISYNNLH